MLPQAAAADITVVGTKGSRPTSSGLDLLFVAAAQQHSNQNRAVSDCGSTITSLSSDIDLSQKERQPPAIVIQQCTPLSKTFFPEVLMDMLNNNQRFASIISWNPDGKSFVIKSRHEFKEKVLPLYFQSNFDSFLRKLKRWGFEKDKIRRRGEPSIEFSHKYFRRDEAGLCLRMRCKSGPGMTEDSCDANDDEQEVMISSLPEDNVVIHQKGALVDQLMNQQASQKRLLEEINKAAITEKFAALTAIRRDRTVDQAPTAEQLMNQRDLLLKKQWIIAAKKAQLARKLSEYIAADERDYQRITHIQRFDQVLDANARSDYAMSRYYRPLSGSLRTQYSREALRVAILAKRQELGLPPSLGLPSTTLPTQSRRFEEIAMIEQPRLFQYGAVAHNVSAAPLTFPTTPSLLSQNIGIPPQADRWLP